MSEKPISLLRGRMIEDMTVRNFVEKTRNDYIRHVRTFTTFLGRAGSFIEGFRTPATVKAASLQSAGIRNPQQYPQQFQTCRCIALTDAMCHGTKSLRDSPLRG